MKKRIVVALMWIASIMSVIHVTNRYTHIEENIMAITKSTLEYIIEEEGKRNKAYKDSKGLWTIGVGHLIKPDEQHLIHASLTDDEVEELLRSDLKWCSEAVESSVRVPLTQAQFDALYSLCFNIGGTAFKRSTVVRRINEGDMQGAADAILMWNKPPELVKRRKRERELFLSGI
jgi:lysozyme